LCGDLDRRVPLKAIFHVGRALSRLAVGATRMFSTMLKRRSVRENRAAVVARA
jgi:hypothetical protein